MTDAQTDAWYYEQEERCFRGLWNVHLSPPGAQAIVDVLSTAWAVAAPDVTFLAHGDVSWSQGRRLVFAPDVCPATVAHEFAHYLEHVFDHDSGPTGHDIVTFNLTALCAAILEET